MSQAVLQERRPARRHEQGPRSGKRLLILGAGKLACELGQSLKWKKISTYHLVGYLDQDASRIGAEFDSGRVIGTYQQLFELVECHRVTTIAVCLDDRRGHLPVETLLEFKAMGLDVVDGHQMLEALVGRMAIDHLKPSWLVFSEGFRRPRRTLAIKRVLDLGLALLGLVLLMPLFVLVGTAIKLDSPGPIMYRQTRIGLWGKPFVMRKFRSMRQDAEAGDAVWAGEDDPRITRVGRWIRTWRVDELPQLVNVLFGRMSLIGPRPERPVFVQTLRKAIPYYDLRHTVRPGITGWAQIRFRYAASGEDSHVKLQYDLYYLKNLSLALDARILLETMRVVLLGQGAR